jgi:hypothetical protein
MIHINSRRYKCSSVNWTSYDLCKATRRWNRAFLVQLADLTFSYSFIQPEGFITTFTTAYHMFLSWDACLQWCFLKLIWIFFHLRLGVSRLPFLNRVHICHLLMSATSPAPVVCLDLIIRFGEGYRLWSSVFDVRSSLVCQNSPRHSVLKVLESSFRRVLTIMYHVHQH